MAKILESLLFTGTSILSLIYAVGGELFTYIVANDLINHCYNMKPENMIPVGITGIVSLALSVPFGSMTCEFYKKSREIK